MKEEFILKIISVLRPSVEKWIIRALTTAGILFITNGLQGFSWFIELFLRILKIESEKKFNINYSINTINWTSIIFGIIFIVLALLLHHIYKNQELRVTKPKKIFVSLIHKSIDDFIKPVYSNLHNFDSKNYNISEITIDQTMIYKNGNLLHPDASLLHQSSILSKVLGLTNNSSNFEIAYFALAHIPLIWDFGKQIADKFPIEYYEYNRHSNIWERLINKNSGGETSFMIDTNVNNISDKNAIIKIEVSYEINNSDIFEVISDYNIITSLKLASIGLDKINNKTQLEQLAKSYRDVIDVIIKDSTIENIHIFYSGPVSLALALSRKISMRTDPNYIVYNYTRNTSPKYKWAVKLSNNNPEILKF